MNKRQEDFLDLLFKQRNLITYAILITQGNTLFEDEDGENLYWDHKTPVSLKEHSEWLRVDAEYRERYEFIETYVIDTFERAVHRMADAGNATIVNTVIKTKLRQRGYTVDDNGMLNVDNIWVGFDKVEQ